MAKHKTAATTVVEFEEQTLSLRAIETLPQFLQIRSTDGMRWVQKYADDKAKGAAFPPVLVGRVIEAGVPLINRRLVLIDGYTRFAAWEKLREPSIRAQIRDVTMTEALLLAIEMNSHALHAGRPFLEADRRRSAELMIRNGAGEPGKGTWDWSNREIGRRCSLSTTTIHVIRSCLSEDEKVPLPKRVLAFRKDGGLTGKGMPYRKTRTTGVPANVQKSNGYSRVQVNGKPTEPDDRTKQHEDEAHPLPLDTTPDMIQYKRYEGHITAVDTEAGILFGRVIGLRNMITFQGRTVEEARQSFVDSVDAYLEDCAADGESPKTTDAVTILRRRCANGGPEALAVTMLAMTWGARVFRSVAEAESRFQARVFKGELSHDDPTGKQFEGEYRTLAPALETVLVAAERFAGDGFTVDGLEDFRLVVEEARATVGSLDMEAEIRPIEELIPLCKGNPRPERYGDVMLADANRAYADLRADPEAWAEELVERAEWDGASDVPTDPSTNPDTEV